MDRTSQQIRFCTTSDGVRIAYAAGGKGPPVVRVAHWLTHIEFDSTSPVWRHILAELARRRTLVRYDSRGCGLSDWDAADLSFAGWVRDLEAVVDAAQLERFALVGISRGGAVAAAYAAKHPKRVTHMLCYGAFAQGPLYYARAAAEREEWESAIRLLELGWDRDNPATRQMFATLMQPDGTPEQHRSFTEMMQVATSAGNAGRLLREIGRVDVRALAPKVACPTLVLHARGDARVPMEQGRLLASLIPRARFVPLESRSHILLESEPAWAEFTGQLRAFLPDAAGWTDAAAYGQLSAREKEILELIAQGLANRDIGLRLGVTDKTVRNHINSIFSKLEVRTRAQAIVLAREAGFGRAAP